MKIFLTFDYNVKKAHNYLKSILNIPCNKELLRKVFKEMRDTITKYILIEYESGYLGYLNENKYFSVDECNIITIGTINIWLLGIIDNETKEFRLTPTITRDQDTLKNFIDKNVQKGNHIIIDGWHDYDFMDLPNSGYLRSKHIHGGGDFGYGRDSTSHIESIWAQIKAKLKETYHSIPSKSFLSFVREIEYKLKTRHLNIEEKIKNFFECFNTTQNVLEKDYENTDKEFMDNLNFQNLVLDEDNDN